MTELKTRLEHHFAEVESSHWVSAFKKAQHYEDLYFATIDEIELADDGILSDDSDDEDLDHILDGSVA